MLKGGLVFTFWHSLLFTNCQDYACISCLLVFA
nr:MAG TPA: hypothetical protein [Caudoviricetes sp.]